MIIWVIWKKKKGYLRCKRRTLNLTSRSIIDSVVCLQKNNIMPGVKNNADNFTKNLYGKYDILKRRVASVKREFQKENQKMKKSLDPAKTDSKTFQALITKNPDSLRKEAPRTSQLPYKNASSYRPFPSSSRSTVLSFPIEIIKSVRTPTSSANSKRHLYSLVFVLLCFFLNVWSFWVWSGNNGWRAHGRNRDLRFSGWD